MPPKTDPADDPAEGAEGAEEQIQNPTLTRRASVMDAIDQARRDMLATEGVEIPADEPEGGQQSFSADANADADTPEGGGQGDRREPDPPAGDLADPPAQGDPAQDDSAPPDLYTVTVDGEQRQVTLEELTRNYQVAGAAHKRLETATEILLNAKRMAAPPQQDAAPARAQNEPADEEAEKTEFVELVKSLQIEDPEVAAEKLADFLKNRPGTQAAPAPDVEAIARTVRERIDFQGALDAFGEAHLDILSDKDRARFAGMKVQNALIAENTAAQKEGRPRASFAQVFANVGKELRTTFNMPAPTPSDTKQDSGIDTSANGNGKRGAQPALKVNTDARVTMKRMTTQAPAPARSSVNPQQQQADQDPEVAIAAQRSAGIAEIAASRRPQLQQQARRAQ